jgi:hypothetical protein
MLRTTLAAFALVAALASSTLAGDCLTCGGGGGRIYGGYGGGPRPLNRGGQWDGYCNEGCNTCADRCCFPLLNHTLHKVGRVVDFLIPDPCCRPRGCCYTAPSANCLPTCGIEPGCGVPYGPGISSDPFIDDHFLPPAPTPMKDARTRSNLVTPSTTRVRSTSQPAPVRPAPQARPLRTASTNQSVLKVAFEDDLFDDVDAPPAAPVSVRQVSPKQEPARLIAKPVIHSAEQLPANPLR